MRYWVCFDLGLTQSFEKLYAWLDDREAVECGDNAATFTYDKPFDAVAKELAATVRNGGRGSRIYLIGKNPTQQRGQRAEQSILGRFIVGKREASPWQGFGGTPSSDEKDEG